MGFDRDLKYGQQAEKALAEFFKSNGYIVTSTSEKGRFEEYDIKVTNISTSESTTYEVKRDSQAVFTHNIAIEVSKTIDGVEQPSGLSTSKADYIVYKIDGMKGYWSMPTDKLKHLIQHNYKFKTKGGDNYRSNLVLIDVNVYKQNATELITFFSKPEITYSNN